MVLNEKRKRDERITLRLSADEKKLITDKAKYRSLTVTDYILVLASAKQDSGLVELYKEILKELKQIEKKISLMKMYDRNLPFEAISDNKRLYDTMIEKISGK